MEQQLVTYTLALLAVVRIHLPVMANLVFQQLFQTAQLSMELIQPFARLASLILIGGTFLKLLMNAWLAARSTQLVLTAHTLEFAKLAQVHKFLKSEELHVSLLLMTARPLTQLIIQDARLVILDSSINLMDYAMTVPP